MNIVPVKTPLLVKKMFPNYVWDITTRGKDLYLTFDDGPTPEITNWVLDCLNAYKAKATFFCVGKNIEAHPDIFQDILKQEHAIGNHTFNHIKGWTTNTKDYLENTKKAQDIINRQLQKNSNLNSQWQCSNLFRPPYGQIKPRQGKQLLALGYKIIMWDILSIDWDSRLSPEQCYKNVTTKSKHGSIIVFHDSLKASKNMQYALPKVLEYFSKKGYNFKTLA